MAERKSLLKRYGILLNHLDFKYVEQCNDPREMEKIVHILQSGEEGYYPDLTKCAEDKLRLLKPNSRLFRREVQIIRSVDVCEADVQPIKEFSTKVRERDRRLAATQADNLGLPPIRSSGKISLTTKDKSDDGAVDQKDTTTSSKTAGKKISSTDYGKWDRYDPDVEILRMDLAEERAEEEIERKNRLNSEKSVKAPLIEEIKEEEERMKRLTDIEKESLSEEYRLRGNEYFRAKEYDFALTEYTRAIMLNPEKDAAAYNNRAITYIKLKKFTDAIKDCEKCLLIEPNNIKAMYRLAQSNMENGFKEKALELFEKVLELDSSHANAKNLANTLRVQISESAPSNATRLRIEEGPAQAKTSTKNTTKASKTCVKKEIQQQNTVNKKTTTSKTISESKNQDYDLASLVRPKEIVPNKWMDTAANMIGKNRNNIDENANNSAADGKTKSSFTENHENDMELRLPMLNQSTNSKPSKPLIEEL